MTTINENGRRSGYSHQRATLTDGEVEAIRSGHESGLSYNMLAKTYGVSKSTVAGIVKFRRRNQILYNVNKPETSHKADQKVPYNTDLRPATRAFIERLGGADFLEGLRKKYEHVVSKNPPINQYEAGERVLKELKELRD